MNKRKPTTRKTVRLDMWGDPIPENPEPRIPRPGVYIGHKGYRLFIDALKEQESRYDHEQG